MESTEGNDVRNMKKVRIGQKYMNERKPEYCAPSPLGKYPSLSAGRGSWCASSFSYTADRNDAYSPAGVYVYFRS